ncbi:hypothetical protein PM082_014964 [Marasmius tenuissimus]|nr:hypothetical protein PM082_014964 [Marasmius tenuissimus]
MPNKVVQGICLAILIVVTFLAIAVAGLVINTLVELGSATVNGLRAQIIALVSSVLTLIACPKLTIVSGVAKSSSVIWNMVEIPELASLAVLWFVTAIRVDQSLILDDINGGSINVSDLCPQQDRMEKVTLESRIDYSTSIFFLEFIVLNIFCTQIPAIRGLAFASFGLLTFYCLFTLLLCLIAKAKDSNRVVWRISAYNAHYFRYEPLTFGPGSQVQYGRFTTNGNGSMAIPMNGMPVNQPIQMPYVVNPGQQPGYGQMPYVVYAQQPPPSMSPGMVMVPMQGHRQGQQQSQPLASPQPTGQRVNGENELER